MQIFFRTVTALCALLLTVCYFGGRNVATLPNRHEGVTFVDRDGSPLGTILASDSAHAEAVPLDRIAPVMQQAILAAEDARFYDHNAVDILGLLRAAREFFVYGEFESGGSTIAMQLARLLHPSPSTIRGKLIQIFDAERIAMRSTHRAILSAYLNRAPMGGNLYGVEAASRTYFDTPARDLDLAQATLLASIPNDPPGLAPDEHMRAARARARYVLDRMLALGEITDAQARRARDERLSAARHDSGIVAAAHALFYLFPQVTSSERVRTTIDRGLQRFVQAQVQTVVATLGPRHVTDGAALVVDNHTGDVLAYVGSPDYFSDAALGRNDGVQALRQPGSSLKPFMYELALERHVIRATTILPDVPSSFAIPGGKLYQPADYSGTFNGPVRVRFALANSLNVPAVRTLSMLGTHAFLHRLHRLGFAELNKPASFYGLGLTLGGGEVSLWDNVQAYVTMARQGDAIPIHLLPQTTLPHVQIGDPATWALVTDMLADDNARVYSFGRHSVLDEPFPAAVKTGTSSDFRDTWTIGFSRDYTVGVWVGNFDGSAMHDVSGVTGAGPLWNRIMLHLHERRSPPPFPKPQGFARVTICATTGHAPLPGCRSIVREWARYSDVADIERREPERLGAEYNGWLATQGQDLAAGGLRIVSPSQGSLFYQNATADAVQRQAQQLPLRAAGAHGTVRWSVDGKRLPLDADGHAFWPVELGTHVIVAKDRTQSDRVAIRVVPEPRLARPGFSLRPLPGGERSPRSSARSLPHKK